MSTKKEIYYKFIFPNYDNLSGSDSDPFPTSDGVDQTGEVRALCRKCPERVITYDQLTAANPKPMYANGTNGWSANKKSAIKNYIDQYLKIPKYFNLRNYEDDINTQRMGMSLMVSGSPEISGDYGGYIKFNSTSDDKIVFCSVMISSGDFFYSWCLPSDVIDKSGLRDEIVTSHFHQNWYLTGNEVMLYRTIPKAAIFNHTDAITIEHNPSSSDYITDPDYPGYPYSNLLACTDSYVNPVIFSEKRVFVQHFFNDYFLYGRHTTLDRNGDPCAVDNYSLINEDLKRDFVELEATRRILYYYDSTRLRNPDNGELIEITSTSDIPILLDPASNPVVPSDVDQNGYNWWRDSLSASTPSFNVPISIYMYNSGNNTWEERTVYTTPENAENNCSKLRNWSKKIAKHLSENIDKLGKNTRISYEPPDIYRTDRGGCPPLQIPYNLLRYSLNDRPPFTDCETVLVMWVATPYYDSNHNLVTPYNISDSDPDRVKKLHDLGWEQYAIPISCRCCFKNPSDRDHGSRHVHNRFLIDYPNKWNYYYTYNSESTAEGSAKNDIINVDASILDYKYHTRRSEMYRTDDEEDTKFKEVLYLQDLIRYSNDYIIAYQNTDSFYYNKGFDIQGYLFKNYSSDFAKLYVSKTYLRPSLNDGHTNTQTSGISMNQQGQFYYIRVNKTDSGGSNVFDINTNGYSSNNRRICICEPGTTDVFKPSDRIYRLNINNEKWIYNASDFIAPTTKVNILGEEKDFGFDDMSYHQTYGYNDWFIYDSYLIALFKKPSGITTLTKQLTLTGHTSLYNDLGNWNNIYISSLGVTQYNPVLVDAVFHGGSQTTIYPLGILDNHIKLDGITYGSTTNNKIVVGFANMLDYLQEGLYHFKFINNEYRPVKTELLDHSSSSPGPVDTPTSYTCTAYVMNYS